MREHVHIILGTTIIRSSFPCLKVELVGFCLLNMYFCICLSRSHKRQNQSVPYLVFKRLLLLLSLINMYFCICLTRSRKRQNQSVPNLVFKRLLLSLGFNMSINLKESKLKTSYSNNLV